MYAEERQQAMAELVNRRGRMSVVDLADQFSVTTETVRRDLSALERLNLVRRVHGGAVSSDALTVIETALHDRDAANPQEKDLIARAALELLPQGDSTLLVDAGTTTVRFVELLPRDRRFTVFTHSVSIAGRLASLPHIELHLFPGRVRRATQAAVGSETVDAIRHVRADLAFLGTNGISRGHGLSTPDYAEASAKTALMAAAHQVVVLADSSKLGVERAISFGSLDQVDVLVTDQAATEEDRTALETAGVKVVVA